MLFSPTMYLLPINPFWAHSSLARFSAFQSVLHDAVWDKHLSGKVPWYMAPYGHIWKTYILIPILHSHPRNTFSILLWHLELNITSHTDVSNCLSLCVMDSVFLTNITFLQRLFNHTFNMWSFWLKGHVYKYVQVYMNKKPYVRELEISDIIGNTAFDENRV